MSLIQAALPLFMLMSSKESYIELIVDLELHLKFINFLKMKNLFVSGWLISALSTGDMECGESTKKL